MAIPAIVPYPLPTEPELPATRVGWRLEAPRAALLVHDMQRYFVDFFPAGAQPMTGVLANIAAIRSAADRHGVPVLYTAQPGGMTRLERGLLHDFWGAGMSTAAEHRRIVPELAPRPHETVLTKWRYSAFARTDLDSELRRLGRDQLLICGIYAHVGCLMTACDAFSRDIQPFLVADGVADFSAEEHRLALDYAAGRCARTLTTSTVLAALDGALASAAQRPGPAVA
jgi:bifunctional isochorismate lyase/aryl carrier protein